MSRIGLSLWTMLLFLLSSHALDLPVYLHYEDSSPNVNLLEDQSRIRARRQVKDDWDHDSFAFPTDVTVEEDKDEDHIYYTMQVNQNKSDLVDKYFVDVEKLLEQKGVVGNKSHSQLSNNYRRAVGVNLTFEFPFYGHKMANVTLATGGFIYIGDQTHNWLAATQYIAPLMANFDTTLDEANILYADDGEKFVVEWRKVQLRNQKEEGPFTFQVTLFKNGDIVFVYKDIPMNVGNISLKQHPVKLGISDAYLFQHIVPGSSPSLSKRVIYEYHRIEVPTDKVNTDTVVVLTAQPTCIGFHNCEDCSNSTLKHFKCSWCHSSKKNGGPFCTDHAGLNRRRQHWVTNNCKEQGKQLYCAGKGDTEVYDDDSETDAPPVAPTQPDSIVPLPTGKTDKAKDEPQGGNGYAGLVFILGLSLVVIGWVAYAYYNPHTTSGQLLIKYRPSRWQIPSSHVRYSASVHM